ncbi:MAG: Asp-tRNA(Asn)/Glu-tRNA(Gln) amidotransferase subunit GatB [Eubacterium sp.]|nr:Asp-tRNA(Asn)/Glu-tRNA(Gln) amidotransferase subunit GatB [Eubacterium sp.]
MSKEYEVMIGLEVHVELNTKTKIFCGCSTAFGGAPNTHVCPVCSGMPGSLPVLNKEVVNKAISVGLATNCHITRNSKFDRKNYFYPDNPQNYQISQLYYPICRNGHVEIEVDNPDGIDSQEMHTLWVDGETDDKCKLITDSERIEKGKALATYKKAVRIHEIHMEEDAGKLVHDAFTDETWVDFNRSGVPLIEIVSEPDMRSADEVIAYLEKLRETVQYLGASDCKLNEGSMRADVNLSIREKGSDKYGTRTESKNLNSFRAIKRCIEAEIERQIDIIEEGGKVVQETRRWDDEKGYSYPMRSKEDAQDYRYFPDPDLVPLVISQEWIDNIRDAQPELRNAKKIRYKEELGLPDYDVDQITSEKALADLFEEAVAEGADPKKTSNWLMVETQRLMKENNLDADQLKFSGTNLAKLVKLVEAKEINNAVAKEVFEKAVFMDNLDPEKYVADNNLSTKADSGQLQEVIKRAIEANPKAVEDVKNGKGKAIGAIVGFVMKEMKGKCDPAEANRLIAEELAKM